MPSPPAKHTLFWLVVHGSYGPGGSDHHRLAELDGAWHSGSFSGVAGARFNDLVVKRYHDEPVPGWALQIAPKPKKPGAATESQGNTSAQLFETWAATDALFGADVVRMDTTFHFDESQPGEGDVCRANTYGSAEMVPDGRYDAPHPLADRLTLWHDVVAGAQHYDPTIFAGMIAELDPAQYPDTFGALANHEGFIERLRRLVQDQMSPEHVVGAPIDFAPQPHNAVDDNALIELARRAITAKSDIIGRAAGSQWTATRDELAALQYQMLVTDSRPELGDAHYELAEHFANTCTVSDNAPWASCLGHACYSLATSYDLAYWLLQDWSGAEGDLEPMYTFWKAGGSVVVDIHGVAHVSTAHTR